MPKLFNSPATSTPQNNTVVFYDLDKVRFVMKDGAGLDIAYAYEDLVFSEHGVFIIQFTGNKADSALLCWFNYQCGQQERQSIFRSLTTTAQLNKVNITYKGTYTMTQVEGKDEINLNFTEA